jgi:hypothetical protein
MRLMGHANWWLPAWLDRILPNLDIEGDSGLPAPVYREVLTPIALAEWGAGAAEADPFDADLVARIEAAYAEMAPELSELLDAFV